MKRQFTSLMRYCLLTASLIGFAMAQESGKPLPQALSNLQFEHEVKLAEIYKPTKSLASSYGKRLAVIATELQQQGNLPGLLAVNAEIETLKKTGTSNPKPPESGEPHLLVEARTIFDRENQLLTAKIARVAEPLIDAYRTRLELLKADYTRQGLLDEALATKNLLTAIPENPIPKPSSFGEAAKRSLKVKVQIDGVSHLHLRGSEIWFDHSKGNASPPGRHQGEFPTYLEDKTEWLPTWTGRVTAPFDAGITLPTDGPQVVINLRFSEGRGHALVVQKPSQENDYVAIIEMRDEREGGGGFNSSDWMEFRLSW